MTVAIVLFAGAVIGYAAYQNATSDDDESSFEVSPAGSVTEPIEAVRGIQDISARDFPAGVHSTKPIRYDSLPPSGGMHDPSWADCTGTIYDTPIRDENAVHSLEHGAVWITYNPSLTPEELDRLRPLVEGQPYTLMSPYPDLPAKVSLQAWGYQLFVDSVDDPRVTQFIQGLRQNPETTPENGASCSNAGFADDPRGPDQPADVPFARTTPPAAPPPASPNEQQPPPPNPGTTQ